jgi:hypothetical protein
MCSMLLPKDYCDGTIPLPSAMGQGAEWEDRADAVAMNATVEFLSALQMVVADSNIEVSIFIGGTK